mmetsp:Transcript_51328/g.133358  ORF Transcript_51328/g.133358 Transcript_51328/m.133358 type:complete len:340 (-) Transcript_51328:347-1366(-)
MAGSGTVETSSKSVESIACRARVPVMPEFHSPTYATRAPWKALRASSAIPGSPGEGMHSKSVSFSHALAHRLRSAFKRGSRLSASPNSTSGGAPRHTRCCQAGGGATSNARTHAPRRSQRYAQYPLPAPSSTTEDSSPQMASMAAALGTANAMCRAPASRPVHSQRWMEERSRASAQSLGLMGPFAWCDAFRTCCSSMLTASHHRERMTRSNAYAPGLQTAPQTGRSIAPQQSAVSESVARIRTTADAAGWLAMSTRSMASSVRTGCGTRTPFLAAAAHRANSKASNAARGLMRARKPTACKPCTPPEPPLPWNARTLSSRAASEARKMRKWLPSWFSV